MGTHNPSKLLPSNVAAESISIDSLSFTDLVSNDHQDLHHHHHHHQPNPTNQVTKQNPEFEFAITIPSSSSNAADLLISNGQLLQPPQAFAFHHSNHHHQPLISSPPHSSLGSLLLPHSSNGKKRSPSSVEKSRARKFEDGKGRSKSRNKDSESKNHSGRNNVFKSLMSPCRECQTSKTRRSIKAQTVPVDHVKIP